MLTKAQLNRTISNLPETFSIDDLIEKLIFMEKVEAGLTQSVEGKVISNEEVKKLIDQWST